MTAYAVGHLTEVDTGPAIVGYLEGIDATLAPFSGKFRIHGGQPEKLEGDWRGHLIVIEFPDIESARAWYWSDAYQDIVALRTDNSKGHIFLIEGVSDDHAAIEVLQSRSAA